MARSFRCGASRMENAPQARGRAVNHTRIAARHAVHEKRHRHSPLFPKRPRPKAASEQRRHFCFLVKPEAISQRRPPSPAVRNPATAGSLSSSKGIRPVKAEFLEYSRMSAAPGHTPLYDPNTGLIRVRICAVRDKLAKWTGRGFCAKPRGPPASGIAWRRHGPRPGTGPWHSSLSWPRLF